MDSLLLKILLALTPVPVVYLIYYRYFVSYRQNYLIHLEAFMYGIVLAVALVLSNLLMTSLFAADLPEWLKKNPFITGFVKAALVEKTGAFIFIAVMLKKRREHLIVIEAVVAAILLGIGFSAVENIGYARDDKISWIIIRFFSAVPMHAATCGMIGYFLSIAYCSNSRSVRTELFLKAALLPFLLHGLFDSFLFQRGYLTYLVGPMLVLMIVMLEFMLARAQTLPPLEALDAMEIRFEDWTSIQREPQFERWILRSMGGKHEQYDSFFQWRLGAGKIAIILALISGAIAFFPLRESIFNLLQVRMSPEEERMLFTALPLAFAVNLLTVGAINPMYFRNSIIRIPIIAEVSLRQGKKKFGSITYDINSFGCFLKTVEEVAPGERIQMQFSCPGFLSPWLEGESIWDNHENPGQPAGTVIRFSAPPSGFSRFLLRYAFFRFVRGVLFNLKIPGFEAIRRLFVQPLSVMQKEKNFKAGTLLFAEGERGRQFYLIRKGEVEIFKTLSNKKEILMTTLGPDSIFGEMSIVSHRPRAASARCKTDCILAVAESTNMDALIESNPTFTAKLISVLSERLHSSEQIMNENLRNSRRKSETREKLFFAALHMMVVGIGRRSEHGSLEVPLDYELIEREFGIGPEVTDNVLQFLMRYESAEEMELEEMERLFGQSIQRAEANYRLLLEEKGDESG